MSSPPPELPDADGVDGVGGVEEPLTGEIHLGAVAAQSSLEGPLEGALDGSYTGQEADGDPAAGTEALGDEGATVLRSSAVMGVGTVVSRISGMLRGAALAAAIGVAGPVADLFGLGNTLPNIVYILIIGGALNAVFVPQLVRHMRSDQDGGDGFADRLITLVGVAMLATTVLAIALAPWIVGLYTSNAYTPEQVALATDITRYCLPQIFFYGAYTMLSQVLNARGRFAAPMFAPIVNNVVSIAAFLAFFWLWGTAPARDGMLTPTQTALLSLGATLGVAAQAAVLIPVVRASGYRFRARFDWRGAGLGRAGSLASWTVGLVLVNQAAYVVIVRLLGTAGALAQDQSAVAQGGLVTYQNAHLIFILPHSIITVSLVTALLPRMSRAAAAEQWTTLAGYVAGGTRTAAAAIVPAAAALVVLGPPIAEVLFGYGAANDAAGSVAFLGRVVSIFALGLLPFTVFYLVLRGWYALEATRTAFWVTVVLNAVNLVLAYGLFRLSQDVLTDVNGVAAIAAAYVIAYWVTALLAWWLLRRRLGGLETGRTVGTVLRISVAAGVALVLMALARWGLDVALTGSKLLLVLEIALVGAVGLGSYLVVSWVLRVGEVTEVLRLVRARLGRR